MGDGAVISGNIWVDTDVAPGCQAGATKIICYKKNQKTQFIDTILQYGTEMIAKTFRGLEEVLATELVVWAQTI